MKKENLNNFGVDGALINLIVWAAVNIFVNLQFELLYRRHLSADFFVSQIGDVSSPPDSQFCSDEPGNLLSLSKRNER